MTFLLLISLASASPSSAIGGVKGPAEERNINIRIPGDDGGEAHLLLAGDEKVKVVKEIESCAFIGINMEDLDEKIIEKFDYPEDTGVLITNIVDDSAADKFGLLEDDIIYSFGGKRVKSSKELADMVKERKPGDKVEIVFYRDGKKKDLKLELGERTYDVLSMDWDKYEDAMKLYAKQAALIGRNALRIGRDWHMSKGKLGLVLKDMDEDLASYFDVKQDDGILVIEVMEESPAAKAGIKAGDVITMVAGEDVSSVDEFLDELYDCTGDEQIEVVLKRKGDEKRVKLDPGEAFSKFMFVPGKEIERIEISDLPDVEAVNDEAFKVMYDKQALEKEIQTLQKEIERLKKRLDKIEKE